MNQWTIYIVIWIVGTNQLFWWHNREREWFTCAYFTWRQYDNTQTANSIFNAQATGTRYTWKCTGRVLHGNAEAPINILVCQAAINSFRNKRKTNSKRHLIVDNNHKHYDISPTAISSAEPMGRVCPLRQMNNCTSLSALHAPQSGNLNTLRAYRMNQKYVEYFSKVYFGILFCLPYSIQISAIATRYSLRILG